jgi:hypothetical protein
MNNWYFFMKRMIAIILCHERKRTYLSLMVRWNIKHIITLFFRQQLCSCGTCTSYLYYALALAPTFCRHCTIFWQDRSEIEDFSPYCFHLYWSMFRLTSHTGNPEDLIGSRLAWLTNRIKRAGKCAVKSIWCPEMLYPMFK